MRQIMMLIAILLALTACNVQVEYNARPTQVSNLDTSTPENTSTPRPTRTPTTTPTPTPPDLSALDLPLPFKRITEAGPYTFYDYANQNYTLTLQVQDKQGGVYDSGEFTLDVKEGPNYIRAYNEAITVDGQLIQPAYTTMRFDITLSDNIFVSGQISRLLPQPDGQYRAGLLAIFEALLAALGV